MQHEARVSDWYLRDGWETLARNFSELHSVNSVVLAEREASTEIGLGKVALLPSLSFSECCIDSLLEAEAFLGNFLLLLMKDE